MKKVLYVATVVKTHIMEFHVPYLKMLKEMGWETAVAAKNDYENPDDCEIPYCDTFYNVPFERNPFKPINLKAYIQLKRIIDEGHYDLIHCHTPVGALITRLAAQGARKKGCKVIYTAHGFHFYKGAPAINWLVYYPVEKYLARKTDVLITITREDFERANSFKANEVKYIPGVGIDLSLFKKGDLDRATKLKSELEIPSDATVFLSVGEVNTNKNHKVVIQVLTDFPHAWFVLCGQGPLINEHRQLAESLGVGNRFITTGYRTDVVDFYNMADIFVFPSVREGLPVALMEAMATELVCVVAKNRGTEDLMQDSMLRFNATNVDDLKEKITIAMTLDCKPEIERNLKRLKQFDINNTLNLMKLLYLEQTNQKA